MHNASSSSGRSVTHVGSFLPHVTASFSLYRAAHVNWVVDELKAAIASAPEVPVEFTAFVTSDNDASSPLDDSASSTSDPEKNAYDEKGDDSMDIKGLQIVSGRPDIQKILEDAVTTSAGPVSVDGAL